MEQRLPTDKKLLRKQAVRRRKQFALKDEASQRIWAKLLQLPHFVRARTVCIYVHYGSEVRTQQSIQQLLKQGDKRVVVPFCDGDDLGLFLLRDFAELCPGAMGILEPKFELRHLADRQVDPRQLDLVVVPGIAFDRMGGRIGHGRGYYDRLLRQVRTDCLKVGVAYECQLFDQVPMFEHDVRMDLVLTEEGEYWNKPLASAKSA